MFFGAFACLSAFLLLLVFMDVYFYCDVYVYFQAFCPDLFHFRACAVVFFSISAALRMTALGLGRGTVTTRTQGIIAAPMHYWHERRGISQSPQNLLHHIEPVRVRGSGRRLSVTGHGNCRFGAV